MRKPFVLAGLAVTLIALVAIGCGDGGNGFDLDDCGNGTLDSGEHCDDGNLSDLDDCLSTCQTASCGDGFVNQGVEECEIGVIPKTCADLGFTSGTLSCTTSCTFDPSGCSGTGGGVTPTPVETVGGPTQTPGPGATPTPTETPTPGPTPVGSTCADGDAIVVQVSLDGEYTGAVVDLTYGASVNLPGSNQDQSVKDRVAIAPSGGLSVKNDSDKQGDDGIDDTVTASFVGSDVVPAGLFVTVTFDCVGGEPKPGAGNFTCTVVSASLQGNTVERSCSIIVE